MDAPRAVHAGEKRHDSVDLSSLAFWSQTAEQRERSFALLRAERPVSWHRPVEGRLLPDPDDTGFWAVVRHEDIVTVSRRTDLFASSAGVLLENIPRGWSKAPSPCSPWTHPGTPRSGGWSAAPSPRGTSWGCDKGSRPTHGGSSPSWPTAPTAGPTSCGTAHRCCPCA
ncbi:hypothetical protein SAZ11_41555 [Streptomyces sp. FXJ1.4098]|nr:hypothetical protein [Streptomyces sp. FXJ1.4098]